MTHDDISSYCFDMSIKSQILIFFLAAAKEPGFEACILVPWLRQKTLVRLLCCFYVTMKLRSCCCALFL
ncbi:hypothetical protein VNO77_17017 [Canavalia gladiata]|uniref:Uncharacterized protein n=1 Tax=Canavalia gladiata TaxID=3824 RepID=A0AAN9LI62_CANGL